MAQACGHHQRTITPAPEGRRRPYGARDLAHMLGHPLEWFYRHRAQLHAAGMPHPISPVGHPRWDADSFDAWRKRHHPNAPQGPVANDSSGPRPMTDAEHQADLHLHYGSRGVA